MIFNGGQILNMAGLSSVCLDTDLLCVCVCVCGQCYMANEQLTTGLLVSVLQSREG